MNAPRALLRSLLVASIAVAAWGCSGGDALPRRPLSGKVTLDGQPLDSAMITFMPTAAGGDTTSAAAQVTAGSFSIPESSGLIAGNYRVAVSATKEVARKGTGKKQINNATGEVMDDVDATVTKESLPARYNTKSELTADVTDAGPNEFTFDLKSK